MSKLYVTTVLMVTTVLFFSFVYSQDIEPIPICDRSPTVLVAINDKVMARGLTIYTRLGQDSVLVEEISDRLPIEGFASSLLTQYLLAANINLLEPNALMENLKQLEYPEQTQEQFLTYLSKLKNDFVITSILEVNSVPRSLSSGNTLFDSTAFLNVSIYTSSGKVLGEYLVEGRSRNQYPLKEKAEFHAVEKALETLAQDDFLRPSHALIKTICNTKTATSPQNSDSGPLEVRIGQIKYGLANDMYSAIKEIVGEDNVNFVFNEAAAIYNVESSSNQDVDSIIEVLLTIDNRLELKTRNNASLILERGSR